MADADAVAPLSEVEAAALFADLADLPGLLLAVSGGPDSTALLFLMARWRGTLRTGPDLLAATVDHGLRPQSRQEAAAVGDLAARLGVPHRTLVWRGEKPRTGLQEAARAARYQLLAQAARRAGMRHIVTAHTRDDQAETVLFRLARGSGIAGLAGMTRIAPVPVAGTGGLTLVRPFLNVAKARLVATLERAGIPYIEDPSNRDPRFARARLRAAMPLLAAEGLDAEKLSRAADRARRADAALDWAAAEVMHRLPSERSPGGGRVVASLLEFRSWPAEIALRILRRHIEAEGSEGPVELGKLEALLAALQTAAETGQKRWRRTLAGAAVSLVGGKVVVDPAPPRRRPKGAKARGLRAAAAASNVSPALRRIIRT
ncbi:MAG: tRNA lysidine(34) synthetase TilS [Variibacter sp.]|nr:tRNA lysidine(34) synthetase TilS [Variibacter sp.]